jgi:hypothetical protein
MVFFPNEWITHPNDVREHVRVCQPDHPPTAEEGAATEPPVQVPPPTPPASPPIPSEPLAPVPEASHEAAPAS